MQILTVNGIFIFIFITVYIVRVNIINLQDNGQGYTRGRKGVMCKLLYLICYYHYYYNNKHKRITFQSSKHI